MTDFISTQTKFTSLVKLDDKKLRDASFPPNVIAFLGYRVDGLIRH